MTDTDGNMPRVRVGIGCGLGCGLLFCLFGFYSLFMWSMGTISPPLLLCALAVVALATGVGKVVQRLADRLTERHGYRGDS